MKPLTASWGAVMVAATLIVYPAYQAKTRQPTPRMNQATIVKVVTKQVQKQQPVHQQTPFNAHQKQNIQHLNQGG